MAATELRCTRCDGTGKWDAGTEDEGPCRGDYCHDGALVCAWCWDHSASDMPAVGIHTAYLDHGQKIETPGCKSHLERATRMDDR